MSNKNNEWDKPYADTPEGTEHWKAIIDLLKHVTTLSTGLSVLILAVYRYFKFDSPSWLLNSSILLFVCAAIGSLIAHVVFVATFRRGFHLKTDRDTAGWALALCALCFSAALFLLLTYFLIGVLAT